MNNLVSALSGIASVYDDNEIMVCPSSPTLPSFSILTPLQASPSLQERSTTDENRAYPSSGSVLAPRPYPPSHSGNVIYKADYHSQSSNSSQRSEAPNLPIIRRKKVLRGRGTGTRRGRGGSMTTNFSGGMLSEEVGVLSSGEERGMLSGEEKGMLSGTEGGMLSGEEKGMLSGEEGGMLSGEEKGMLSGEEGGMLSGEEKGMLSGEEKCDFGDGLVENCEDGERGQEGRGAGGEKRHVGVIIKKDEEAQRKSSSEVEAEISGASSSHPMNGKKVVKRRKKLPKPTGWSFSLISLFLFHFLFSLSLSFSLFTF